MTTDFLVRDQKWTIIDLKRGDVTKLNGTKIGGALYWEQNVLVLVIKLPRLLA